MATAKQTVDFPGAIVRQFLGVLGSGNPTWKTPTDWKTTRFEEVQVTPALAQFIYDELGDFNRRISPTDPKVIEFADDMKNDRWAKVGLVEFDTDGHLTNGYHRMLAIILAGVTVTMFFRYGADPKDYVAFDKGKNRDGQDIFEIEAQILGEEITSGDAKLMSSAMLWIVQYECGKASIPFKITSYHQRDFYRKRFSEKRGEDYDLRSWALPLARKAAKALHVAESVVFSLIVLGHRTEGKKGATKEFWNAVATSVGFTGEDDARRRFIKRIDTMIEEAAKYKMKVQRGAVYLLGLKCMRAYFDGEDVPVNFHNPKKIVRLSSEHDEIFGDITTFESPYGEKAVFDEENTKLVEELVTKHEERGK